MSREYPSEIAWSWPAVVFALVIPAVFVAEWLAWALFFCAFGPACWLRDWYVRPCRERWARESRAK